MRSKRRPDDSTAWPMDVQKLCGSLAENSAVSEGLGLSHRSLGSFKSTGNDERVLNLIEALSNPPCPHKLDSDNSVKEAFFFLLLFLLLLSLFKEDVLDSFVDD